MQAGEEMLRSKPLEEGGFDHNSYRSPDSVNSLKWGDLNEEAYQQVRDYYAGLIAFRKAHPALRMTTAADVEANITKLRDLETGVIAFQFALETNGEDNDGMFVVFNGRSKAATVDLPEGRWTIYVQGDQAGTQALGTASGSITVDSISTTILVLEKAASEPVGEGQNNLWMILAIVVGSLLATGVVAALIVILIVKRKK
jgi:pullulanase